MFVCGCSESHSAGARDYAYRVLYQIQKERGDKINWREEREIFMMAAHEYDTQHPGKIS